MLLQQLSSDHDSRYGEGAYHVTQVSRYKKNPPADGRKYGWLPGPGVVFDGTDHYTGSVFDRYICCRKCMGYSSTYIPAFVNRSGCHLDGHEGGSGYDGSPGSTRHRYINLPQLWHHERKTVGSGYE